MLTTEEVKKERKRQIAAYRASGLKGKDWCEQNGVSLNSLRYWIKQMNCEEGKGKSFKESRNAPQFVSLPTSGILAVEPPKNSLSSSSPTIVLHAGKYSIDINNNCNPIILEAILNTINRYV